MESLRKISIFFNVVFILILVAIVLYIGFSFTKVLYIGLFEDERLVEDKAVISELQECVTKYYDYLYYGEYEKVKYTTAILSRKSTFEYEDIHNEILTWRRLCSMYKVCVQVIW